MRSHTVHRDAIYIPRPQRLHTARRGGVMALRLNQLQLPPGSVVIVYDIEAIGDVETPASCYIWNLAAQVLGENNLTFEQYIVPPLTTIPEPAHPKLYRVTPEFLASSGARPWPTVIDYFWKWVSNLYHPAEGGLCVLVSHGNFRFDKPVFEAEHRRYCSPYPANVVFFDTLHWFRTVLRHESSYSLLDLYRKTFKSDIHNQHLAIYDVYALNRLIGTYEVPLTGTVYPMGATPMLRIPMVGQHTERLLIDGGFESIESIAAFGARHSGVTEFTEALCERVGWTLMPTTAASIVNYVTEGTECATECATACASTCRPISAATGGQTELPTPMVTVAFVERTV